MSKLLFRTSLLALTLGIASIQGAIADGSNTMMSSQSQDSHLAKKIHDKIGEGWFSRGYEHVQAQVNNGIVTLTGSVKNESEKETLEKDIRNMEGVKKLDSRLQVLDRSDRPTSDKFVHDTFSTPADQQLNKKIRDQISKGWLWDSYKHVILKTNNGVVTLSGKISSLDDQKKLVNEIQKIEGVKAVTNQLSVEKSSW